MPEEVDESWESASAEESESSGIGLNELYKVTVLITIVKISPSVNIQNPTC